MIVPTKVEEIELSPAPIPVRREQQLSPLVEVGFRDDVVGKVSPLHMEHRNQCVFDPHCAWCAQAGKATMELRKYQELDAIAEQRLMALVRKGHKEATLFYLQRKQRNESLWSRIRVLLGIGGQNG